MHCLGSVVSTLHSSRSQWVGRGVTAGETTCIAAYGRSPDSAAAQPHRRTLSVLPSLPDYLKESEVGIALCELLTFKCGG